MLILSHAYRLRIDLYQLGQRVLQPARYRSRAPFANIEIRMLFSCKLARRIYRRTCFIDDRIAKTSAPSLLFVIADEIRYDLFGLPRCGTVAYRNNINTAAVAEVFEHFYRLCHSVLRRGRVDHGSLKDLSGRITDSELAARTESRVPPQYSLALQRRLHQKLLKIRAEYLYSAFLRRLRQAASYLCFNGRRDKSFVAVFDRGFNVWSAGFRNPAQHSALKVPVYVLRRSLHRHRKYLLFLSAVYRQHSVPRDL